MSPGVDILSDRLGGTSLVPVAETAGHSVRAHAILSASGAKRFIACPGSVRLCEGRESPSSVFALEGTAAHELAQLCLETGADAIDYLGKDVEGVVVDAGYAEYLQVYLDRCRQYMVAEDGWVWWIERRVTLEALGPPLPMFGTADFVAYNTRTGEMVVVDLKWGQGVVVTAFNNPQLRYYGLGSALGLPPEYPGVQSVRMVIVQPRARTATQVTEEVIDFQKLLNWAQEVLLPAARRTQEPGAPLASGEHCRFCTAAGVCPQQAMTAIEAAQLEFESVVDPGAVIVPDDVTVMDIRKLGGICRHADVIRKFLDAAEAAAKAMELQGIDVPGVKVVDGVPGHDRWVDGDEVVAGVLVDGFGIPEDRVYKRTVISPAAARGVYADVAKGRGDFKTKKEAEAAFRKELASGLSHRPPSGPVLVVDEDERPALASSAASTFQALEANSALELLEH